MAQTIQHANITDPKIHEPKGISTALADTVYVANGSGSGTWKGIDIGLVEEFNVSSPVVGQALTYSGTKWENNYIGYQLSNAKDYGAVGDGVTDDTAALNSLHAAVGIGVLGEGNYSAPGGLTGTAKPKLYFSDNAQINGTDIPFLTITDNGLKQFPSNLVFIEQDTTDRNDPVTLQVHRNVNTDDGVPNPKALRVATTVNDIDNSQTEWAISGELISYSNAGSKGSAAVSGVANKYGVAEVFGGHFQAKDWNIYANTTSVTTLVGAEINIPAVGLDHPTANNGLGNRRALDIISRTNRSVTDWDTAGGNDGEAEFGAGVVIRTDETTLGTWRYGLAIDDVSQSSNSSIGTAALIRTTGDKGIDLSGSTHSVASIHMGTGEFLAMSDDASRKFRYNFGTDSFDFQNASTVRAYIRVNASPMLAFNGTQVIGTRITGWGAPTGTATRTTFDTTTVTTEQLAERVHALIDDLTTHGMIGA